jgi:hypothetical protein
MKPRKADAESSNKRRSEVVTVRLDPRLKYLAEIAGRKQRRTLSGYIEWAVEQSLQRVLLRETDNSRDDVSVAAAESMFNLWDVEEADRVVRLAIEFPELLTYEEQLIWKLVRDCGYLWKGGYSASDGKWEWTVSLSKLIWDRLREHWPTFKKVADGEFSKERLPAWLKYDESKIKPQARPASPLEKPSSSFGRSASPIDEDIPF